jgi:CDGSH-type Zn-finger protein
MRFVHDKAAIHPLIVELEPGTYHWCRCGQTKTPPYCDGSHGGTDITPLEFEIDEAKTVAICNCGLTGNPPFCDGSHNAL